MLKRAPAILACLIVTVGLAGNARMASAQAPSNATRAREVRTAPAAEVTVTLNEQFFNSLLDAIFTRLRAPQYPLSLAGLSVEGQKDAAVQLRRPSFSLSHAGAGADTCESVVMLEREMGGVRTQVRFENGRVVAPLAFKGNYSMALLGCISFQGWADTVI
ncbi:MAG TPA: hypothetical protein VEV81_12135, partial [Pyrinomonadaceae bacterium]|nr:hypothetical protein [Pyrinomonadaceae bacterium]